MSSQYSITPKLDRFTDEAFVPTRLVLDDEDLERIAARLEAPPSPTAELRGLMRGADD